MIDTSVVRVHQHGACIADNNHQDIGRSQGGLTSKVHALVDINGLPVQLGLTGKARSQGAAAWRADTGRAGTDFAAASPRSFSFDKRSQFSASASQSDRLAGSRFASCLHSAARKLNSSRVVIAAPPA